MKVYVVVQVMEEDAAVRGVFSTRERAEAYRAGRPGMDEQHSFGLIEEWELDA